MLGPVILDLQGHELTGDEEALLQHPHLGGVILFSRNFASVEQLQSLIGKIREIRSELLLCVDQEGGRVQRFRHGFSVLPALKQIGDLYQHNSSKGLFVAYKCAWLMACELRAVGVDLSFAPVVDADDHFSEVIGDRSFSPDVETVTALTKAYIKGMNEAGMAATLKHFPGHGGVKGDSHVTQPVDHRSFEEVEASDMQAFTHTLSLAGAVMPAHIRFPLIDEHSVGFSPFWVQDVLRKRLKFDGIVFSDDLSMEGASVAGDHVSRSFAALRAGCEGILVCNAPAKARDVLYALEQEKWPITDRLSALRPHACGLPDSMESLKATAAWHDAQRILKMVMPET